MSQVLDLGSEKLAAAICGTLHEMFAQLEGLIGLVEREVESEENAIKFREALAQVCGAIVLDVLAPIYRRYPVLKPDTWPKDL